MSRLDVFVPADGRGDALGIAPGSAIVGTPEGDSIRIDYEGNIYGRAQLHGYAMRVLIAAGRHIERYPTVARALVDPAHLIHIGRWDAHAEQLDLDAAGTTHLVAWLGVDHLGEGDLVAPTARRAQRDGIIHALQGDNPVAAAVYAIQHGHEDLVPSGLRRLALPFARRHTARQIGA